jgi:hypothetical protein
MVTGGNVVDWNIYAPSWAPISIVDFPSVDNKSLELQDKDPYDYARAIRVIKEGHVAQIKMRVYAKQMDNGILEIDVVNRFGNRPVRLKFDNDGKIKAFNGAAEVVLQPFRLNNWYQLVINVDASPFGNYSLSINGKNVLDNAQLAEAVLSVERISFRTGTYRDLPNRNTKNQEPEPPLTGADEPVPLAVFNIDDVHAEVK